MNRTPKGEARKDPPFFAVDAAEAAAIERGCPVTDKEVKRLGYLGTEGVCGNSPFRQHL